MIWLQAISDVSSVSGTMCFLVPGEHINHVLTNVTRAVFPAPLGPRSRNVLTGGDATVR